MNPLTVSGPALARETLDQLESAIVDVDKAAGTDPDAAAPVAGAHEPPD